MNDRVDGTGEKSSAVRGRTKSPKMLESERKTQTKNERATHAEAKQALSNHCGQYRHSKRKGAGWGIVSIFQGLTPKQKRDE